MTPTALASCEMIQHLTIVVSGDVHFDGLVLAAVVLLLAVVARRKH